MSDRCGCDPDHDDCVCGCHGAQWQDPAFQQRPSFAQLCAKRPGCLAPDGHDGPHSVSAWDYERKTP